MKKLNVITIDQSKTFKERKKRRRVLADRGVKFYSIILLFLSVVFLNIFFFIESTYANVVEIRVQGLKNIHKKELLGLLDVGYDSNSVLFKTELSEDSIKAHPLVERVAISKGIGRLDVNVVEKEIIGCAIGENITHPISAKGEVIQLESLNSSLCQGIFFYDIADKDGYESVELFVPELMKLEPTVVKMIEGIYREPLYQDNNRFSLVMKDGNIVKVNSYTMVEKISHYPIMVSQIRSAYGDVKGVFHLDVGDRFVANADVLVPLEKEE